MKTCLNAECDVSLPFTSGSNAMASVVSPQPIMPGIPSLLVGQELWGKAEEQFFVTFPGPADLAPSLLRAFSIRF